MHMSHNSKILRNILWINKRKFSKNFRIIIIGPEIILIDFENHRLIRINTRFN